MEKKNLKNAQWVSLFTLDVTVALVVQKAFFPEVQQDEFHINKILQFLGYIIGGLHSLLNCILLTLFFFLLDSFLLSVEDDLREMEDVPLMEVWPLDG